MILVDTSVWVDYLRGVCPSLSSLLERNQVVMHPLIIGELACGNLKNRTQLLTLWRSLESLHTTSHEETLFFIEKNKLMEKGVGFIDVQLLAAVTISQNVKLWTRDKRLAKLAKQLGCHYTE